LFLLKIASSGRSALAGMRWAHFNCDDRNIVRSTLRRSTPRQRAMLTVNNCIKVRL
jgi:hypothetical protein